MIILIVSTAVVCVGLVAHQVMRWREYRIEQLRELSNGKRER